MLLNYSYRLIAEDESVILEGSVMSLVLAAPNATARYIDVNPVDQDISPGDSVWIKDIPVVPEGSIFELYYKSYEDPVGSAILRK